MKLIFSNASIKSIATCLPQKKITLEDQVDLLYGGDLKKLQRIQKSIGLHSRYITTEETTLDLCYEASIKILQDDIKKSIDAVIFVTQTPDFLQPNNAHILHGKLGLKEDCACFDVNQGCSGYVYGLLLAYSLIQSGAENILLCAGDTISKIVCPADSNTTPLFGDAGSATLITKNHTKSFFSLHSNGNGWDNIILPNSGFRQLQNKQKFETKTHYLCMDGAEVFNFSIDKEPKAIREILQYANQQISEIDYIFFHQANAYIISNIIRRLGIESHKAPIDSISKYGNTSSSSIPLAICDSIHTSIDNDFKVILSGFGVGLSWATALLTLQKNTIIHKPFFYQGAQ